MEPGMTRTKYALMVLTLNLGSHFLTVSQPADSDTALAVYMLAIVGLAFTHVARMDTLGWAGWQKAWRVIVALFVPFAWLVWAFDKTGNTERVTAETSQ